MARRNTVLKAILVPGLIYGVIAANFVLHRWMLGNTASRQVDAGTVPVITGDDLDEFAPTRRPSSALAPADPASRREQLRKLIAGKLPNASEEERNAWLEELSNVSLPVAEGILDLRDQVGGAAGFVEAFDRTPNE